MKSSIRQRVGCWSSHPGLHIYTYHFLLFSSHFVLMMSLVSDSKRRLQNMNTVENPNSIQKSHHSNLQTKKVFLFCFRLDIRFNLVLFEYIYIYIYIYIWKCFARFSLGSRICHVCDISFLLRLKF